MSMKFLKLTLIGLAGLLILSMTGCATLERMGRGYETEEAVTFYMKVFSAPSDAEIYINDRLVGRTPCERVPLYVRYKCFNDALGGKSCSTDGLYILRVSKTGYKDAIETIPFSRDEISSTYTAIQKLIYYFNLETERIKEGESKSSELPVIVSPKEIDYQNINLLKSDRVIGPTDTYGDKTVFIACISELNIDMAKPSNFAQNWENFDKLKYEIFVSDPDGNNQKRLTKSKDGVLSVGDLMFTKEGKTIIFREMSKGKEGEDYYVTGRTEDGRPWVTYNKEKYDIYGKPDSFMGISKDRKTMIEDRFLNNYYLLHLDSGEKVQITIDEVLRMAEERKK